jgi:phosphate transport system substrate-binding protein
MMQMFKPKEAFLASGILFLTLGTVTPQFRFTSLRLSPVLAQVSPEEFEVPESVPRGTTVRLDGSSSMAKVNQALKERFERQYPNSDVQLNAAGSTAALKALVNEEIDLAAIGRPLTAVEKAQGLVQIPLSRQKIAILVGPNSPYRDIDITFEQFSRIFRGEITDWSELGGEPGPIQLIDRPEYSDTRRAFQRYDVFKAAPFRTGANTTQVERDSTDAVIAELGKNAGGIGYAIADQVFDRQDVKIIPMHKVFPDDERYPFSQSLECNLVSLLSFRLHPDVNKRAPT